MQYKSKLKIAEFSLKYKRELRSYRKTTKLKLKSLKNEK